MDAGGRVTQDAQTEGWGEGGAISRVARISLGAIRGVAIPDGAAYRVLSGLRGVQAGTPYSTNFNSGLSALRGGKRSLAIRPLTSLNSLSASSLEKSSP